nr:putative RNA-directed DNA polymerase, eukaryota, reverse transcriptase zinc-binding domain protein [Tanacetum cinerariifolium]
MRRCVPCQANDTMRIDYGIESQGRNNLSKEEILEEYLKEMKEDLVRNFEYQKSDSSMKASSEDENQFNCLAGELQDLEDPEEIPMEDIFKEIRNTVSRRISKGESSKKKLQYPCLVSNSVMDAFTDLKVTALARGWSDHIPLMLHNEKVDYGLVAFNFFHSWMQRDGFEEVIKTAYEECSQGTMINGEWVTNPQHVKMAFLNFYKEKFDDHASTMNFSLVTPQSRLNESESSALECGVTMDEKYEEIFKYDIEASVEQSAFISGQQILDGPLMLSEVMYWYKNQNKKLMIFKVDFEKAYDSVSWKFLDHMLASLGFGVRWRNWIQACSKSPRSSILVNGSATSEFSIKRGLRQGDPLSPFLFIIITEGRHLALKDVIPLGLFRGTKVFYLTSGLKINSAKSDVYGIGVSSDDIVDMARATRCVSGTLSFIYLGLPIGSNMNLIANGNLLLIGFVGNCRHRKPRCCQWEACVIKAIHRIDAGMDGKWCKNKVIKESLVKMKQKGAILELNQRHLNNIIFCYNTSNPAMKIRCISAISAQETSNDQYPIRRITLQPYAVCTPVH